LLRQHPTNYRHCARSIRRWNKIQNGTVFDKHKKVTKGVVSLRQDIIPTGLKKRPFLRVCAEALQDQLLRLTISQERPLGKIQSRECILLRGKLFVCWQSERGCCRDVADQLDAGCVLEHPTARAVCERTRLEQLSLSDFGNVLQETARRQKAIPMVRGGRAGLHDCDEGVFLNDFVSMAFASSQLPKK
jgi:hypothetical protein